MEEKKKELARKIWDMPFASSNLHKLTKVELLTLIDAILIDISYKDGWNELDIKDLLFEQKCWLIELLDSRFFEERSQKWNINLYSVERQNK